MVTPKAWRSIPLLACALFGTTAGAQQPRSPQEPSAQVLLLGVYHFDNPGLDVVVTQVPDVLTASKQAEIEEVVEALARFRPTQVAVEVRPDRAARLDSLYRAYRAGRHELGRNEVQQLGFRLADRFDHQRLFAIDMGGEFPFGAVMEYAGAHDPEALERIQAALADLTAEAERLQRDHTVGEILRIENDPERIAWGHGLYMDLARVGSGDTFVGADLLSKWYTRNVHIFANVQRIAGPGDRVLVIVGAGHAAILRELIRSDLRLELVEAIPYLPADGSGGRP